MVGLDGVKPWMLLGMFPKKYREQKSKSSMSLVDADVRRAVELDDASATRTADLVAQDVIVLDVLMCQTLLVTNELQDAVAVDTMYA